MAANLLHSLTDDNPDLQKQIGCMTGIFQLFDRHQILTGRRIAGHSHKRLPPGSSHFNNGSFEAESNDIYHRAATMEKYSNKNVLEKQRVSTESSRTSFSSSSCSSSFSSLDCNKTVQPEPLCIEQIIFPETPSRDPAMNQPSASPQFGQETLDLRDVVKDSMYSREVRGLSAKTTTNGEGVSHVPKHKDSPRPLQLSKTNKGSYGMGFSEMQNLPADLKESLKVLAKLQEAPWYFNEARELSRSSSYESKDSSFFSIPKDAPRFSYDGKEINRVSFESRDTSKSSLKLKELPRLSLDSREGSMKSFNSDSKSSFLSRNLQKDSDNTSDKVLGPKQTSGTQTRPPCVVAKLMGLEELPNSATISVSKMGSIKTDPSKDSDPFSGSSKATDLCRPIRMSKSVRNSWKEPTSPQWKNPDSVVKPISRFPIEPAPWKQLDETPGSHKLGPKHLKAPGQNSNFPIQRDNEQKHTSPIENARLVDQQKPQGDCVLASTNKGSNSLRTFDSPIVIMKPAKIVEKSGIPASSVISLDSLSSRPKLQAGNFADNRKGSVNSRTAKDQIPKTSHRDNAVSSADNKTNIRSLRSTQTSTRPQHLPKESTTSSVKSSGSISPRMQQKKLELEKRARPPTPPSDSGKSRRQSNKQQLESTSPGGRRRPKSSNFRQTDNQLSEIGSVSRNLNYKDNDFSLQSDGNIVLGSKIDTEGTSSERSAEINGSQSPSVKAAKYSVSGLVENKSPSILCEDECLVEVAAIAPEYASPVSVLDDAVYMDDATSPLKQMPKTFKDDGIQNTNNNSRKEKWSPADNLISNTTGSGLTSEFNLKKLQNVEQLVLKLRRLNSSHDEARTDYIASLCENTNPDHRYISEILLASGLLLRYLGSGLTTFQFHPSGLPINPELFLVLEQTKMSTLLKEECSIQKVVQLKPDKEKFHRKLIFDSVNEILIQKLALVGPSPEPWVRHDKLARKTLNAQKLLRDLCLEIEQLQAKKSECNLEEEDDSLKNILWEDVMQRSESWTNFHGEISGVVLDVERSIFKDLVDEIVHGEVAGLRAKPGRRCRQLFAK